jgi:hypothetical protein
MAALMRRFGGHPYEQGDVLDFKALDPTKSVYDNLLAMGYNDNELVVGGVRGPGAAAGQGGGGGGRKGGVHAQPAAQAGAPRPTRLQLPTTPSTPTPLLPFTHRPSRPSSTRSRSRSSW